MNRSDIRGAVLPAISVIASARAIAKHYAALLPGGVDGVELLPPERVRTAMELQPVEEPPGTYSKWMLGYHQVEEWAERRNPAHVFGHGGYGGAVSLADLDRRLAVGFTKNLFNKANARARIFELLRAS